MPDIPKLVLDPQNDQELADQYCLRVASASQGQISDTSPSSPVRALAEGSAYAIAELLYYLNMLPEATALEVLRLAGVSRSPGTYATGSLSILLTGQLSSSFYLPAGYQINYQAGRAFILLEPLSIPAGSIEGSVNVRARDLGSAGNYPGFAVSIPNSGLNYVSSIYNPEPIAGGTDLESLEATVLRGSNALRYRAALVSAYDYEVKAVELLGSGSTATCVPLLSSDKQTEKPGHVHVFLLDVTGNPPPIATCQVIQGQLKELAFAGSSTWVSPASLSLVDIEAVLTVPQISADLAQAIQTDLNNYLNPAEYPLGKSLKIKELEFRVRQVLVDTFGRSDDISEVLTLTINRQAVNLPMANAYTLPRIDNLAIAMTDPAGYTQTYYLGAGVGDPV